MHSAPVGRPQSLPQHHSHEVACTEKLRLTIRVSLLEKEYNAASVALRGAKGHIDESSYFRRYRDVKRALAEARIAYAAHLSTHCC
jgi:hypothetical protein